MAVDAWKPHLRQAGQFVLAGVAQLALDSSIFIASTALGVPIVAGNLLGRASGATLGFWLNGRYTFADAGQPRLSRRNQKRFAIMWLSLTALSTLILQWTAAHHSLQRVWLIKPMIEAALAVVSFLISRHWVYR
jgi:putative flippase GtrA